MSPGMISAAVRAMPANPGNDKIGNAIKHVAATEIAARMIGIPESLARQIARRREVPDA